MNLNFGTYLSKCIIIYIFQVYTVIFTETFTVQIETGINTLCWIVAVFDLIEQKAFVYYHSLYQRIVDLFCHRQFAKPALATQKRATNVINDELKI
jgi:hypothetical protein